MAGNSQDIESRKSVASTARAQEHTARGGASKVKPRGDSGKPEVSKVADTAASFVENVKDRAEDIGESLSDTYDGVTDAVQEKYKRGRKTAQRMVREGRRQVFTASDRTAEYFDEHPLMIGALGLAGGFLLGALLPHTRREHKYLGGWRDELQRQSVKYGEKISSSVRHAAEQGLENARDWTESGIKRAAPGMEKESAQFEASNSSHNRGANTVN